MRRLVLGLVAACAVPPGLCAAQPQRPTLDHPSARNGLNEQLGEVATRIDHRRADGRLTPDQATDAQREVNDLQAQIAQKRIEDGGQLTERDRFDIQDRIRQLVVRIDQESAPARR